MRKVLGGVSVEKKDCLAALQLTHWTVHKVSSCAGSHSLIESWNEMFVFSDVIFAKNMQKREIGNTYSIRILIHKRFKKIIFFFDFPDLEILAF